MNEAQVFRILFVGDVYGELGIRALRRFTTEEKARLGWDFVVANGENADALGMSPDQARQILDLGVNCITGGNHTFENSDIVRTMEQEPRIVRPANHRAGTPGRGLYSERIGDSTELVVVNLLTREGMQNDVASPFDTLDEILSAKIGDRSIALIDLHGESSFEKQALFHYVDGRVAAVIGTHTHVQTADERVSDAGTAYITDLGMTGPSDSIAGVIPSDFIDYYRTSHEAQLHAQTQGGATLCGAIVSIDPGTQRAKDIVRIRRDYHDAGE
jgi:metallophosphoesterase (TIGR00282 family)